MKEICDLEPNERRQISIFFGLALAVMIVTGILSYSNPGIFGRYLGNVNPLVAVIGFTLLGMGLHTFILFKGWFIIYKKQHYFTILKNSIITILFVVPAILADLQGVFPMEMNVRYPESLLFYPTMAFVVEILFHLSPLVILLMVFSCLFKKLSNNNKVWIAIIVASLCEPLYQSWFGIVEQQPNWSVLVIGVNLYAFNVFQLLMFKKYGFLMMYGSRLVYYLFWHVIWGALRLDLLF